ncbi:galactokinase [Aquisalinus flavus]|uniref:Galactokinase n=1 Tax=Aquisalinus flavus TaxID=1526572 RepID=A0A8J2Y5B3_9PROT|nr:galactokinase [Aquisalinus flavus]MBD0426055.1 galactokinase [Aquisalinus flavus]UNE48358.1 galactokinase [Aquisalinus flavus]GGD11063.1 galactokinase [Aquisalinus flavus]
MSIFEKTFGYGPKTVQTVPGRVNIIGEHTDYNGGAVLPALVDRSMTVSLAPADGDTLRIYSRGFDEMKQRPAAFVRDGHWSDYAAAAFAFLGDKGLFKGGADVTLESDIPAGTGLSSSAALLVACLKAARDIGAFDEDDKTIALWAQKIENDYLGVPCGIMDQMAVALAEPGTALFLNTLTLETEKIALPGGHVMAVAHSGVERRLDEGRYAVRRAECEEGKTLLGEPNPCLMDEATLKRALALDEPINRRMRHQRTEHLRVLAAVDAIRRGDAAGLGRLMDESHVSMRDDFEITHPVLDEMVIRARHHGALGSRMTGGGFGGCFVSLVPEDGLARWQQAMTGDFPQITMI